MKHSIIFGIIAMCLFSCKKAEDRKCFKSTGKHEVDTIALPDFHGLILMHNIEFHLVPDSANFAILKGGKNLLNFITFTPQDSSLVVSNENKCNFLRTYKKHIYVEIHFKQLNRLEYRGSYPITNEGTLHSGAFNLFIDEGAGTVELTVDAKYFNGYIAGGVGDFIIKGQADVAVLDIKGQGFCDTRQFAVKELLVARNYSHGYLKCFPDGANFQAEIFSVGNIYYTGNPASISQNITGKGSLIKE